MEKHSIGTRYIALLLLVAMVFSFVPAIGVHAAPEHRNEDYNLSFQSAADQGVTLLNNGKNTSLSIKINNFVNDGILFEYLQQTSHEFLSAEEYLFEFIHNVEGKAFAQLYPYHLSSDDEFEWKNGFSDMIVADGTLDVNSKTEGDSTGTGTDGEEVDRTSRPVSYDGGNDLDVIRLNATEGAKEGERIWTKLTTFKNTNSNASTRGVQANQIRYAVIVYRLPNSDYGEKLDTFGLTVNEYDGKKSEFVDRGKINENSSDLDTWQYAIIDLLGGDEIKGTDWVKTVYLHAPCDGALNSKGNYYRSMDIAAVGYFPYYGDAEQFAYYGVSMGSKDKYMATYNGVFSFHNPAVYDDRTSDTSVQMIDTIANMFPHEIYQLPGGEFNFGAGNSTNDRIGYELFGAVNSTTKSPVVMGLLEPYLENGYPVYKKEVVEYVATSMQYLLTKVEEYPSDNGGWRNYGFITGSSTSNGKDAALYGKDDYNRSIDLGAAICKQLGVDKGSGADLNSEASVEKLGTFADTKSRASQLIGPWKQCKGNITSWMDAAYYLLHNLYVTNNDVADKDTVDGYGDYENDYQSLVLSQAIVKGEKTYFFDSSYAHNIGFDVDSTTEQKLPLMWSDNPPFESAIEFDRAQHSISMNGNADGKAMYNTVPLFPFLPTSGNGIQAGETNSPYYMHGGNNRHPYGSTYELRDYLYSMTGSGYFQYNYADNLYFNFMGDDDVYLFINGQMVLDLGGCHQALYYEMTLNDYVDWARALKADEEAYNALDEIEKARVDALCLEDGKLYNFDFFYMDRHGNGANLRILTNITMGLDVDKQAYQGNHEVADNGLVNSDQPIEYSFSLNNDTDYKLYNLTFDDATIGISLTPDKGLVVADGARVTNAYNTPLMPNNLKISVDGYDSSGNKLDTVTVTCANNEELMQFLKNLASDDDTGTGYEDDLYAGDGLWKDATVTIRGIYYQMTEEQKTATSFTNTVLITAGNQDGSKLSGTTKHTVHNTDNAISYYQWVGKDENNEDRYIIITRDKLRADLINDEYVTSDKLPAAGNMILIPTDMTGSEIVDDYVSNTPGGDVYLKVCYTEVGTYISYVTIKDSAGLVPTLTVPIMVHAVGGKDSLFVLDYGLDTDLTEGGAIFKYEIDAAAGKATGTVLGIAEDSTGTSYDYFDTSSVQQNVGNVTNGLTELTGKTSSYYKLDTPINLLHNKPWVIEWKAKFDDNRETLFSSVDHAHIGNSVTLYIRSLSGSNNNGKSRIGFSIYDTDFVTYGVSLDDYRGQECEFLIRNVISADGSNMPHLYINGTHIGPMNTKQTADSANTSTANTLSGLDMKFEYIGTYEYEPNKAYEYIRVYEDGMQLSHYNWEMSDNVLTATTTEESGYIGNDATLSSGAISDGTLARDDNDNAVSWKLEEPVVLMHNLPWEISYTAQINSQSAIFHQTNNFANGSKGLYMYPADDRIGITIRRDSSNTTLHGIKITDYIKDFDMNAREYTYTLKNHVEPDGSNMIHLYVDSKYVGPFTSQYNGTTLLSAKDNTLDGMNLVFGYIGHSNKNHGLRSNSILKSMKISLNTKLENVYEWKHTGSNAASGWENINKLTDNGNRLVFNSTDKQIIFEEGDFTYTYVLENDGKLKFQMKNFLENAYSIYVAMAIHDIGAEITPLGKEPIDISKEVQLVKKVTVLPASVVYYEDSFPAINYPIGTDSFEIITDASLSLQQQSPNQDTPHGSDPFYSNDTGDWSGSTAHKITIDDNDPLAWFEFTGTGFEISASTNAKNSGILMVDVYKAEDVAKNENGVITLKSGKSIHKRIPVISEFDNQANGWDGDEAIYQVPLIRYNTAEKTKYLVVINGVPLYDSFEQTGVDENGEPIYSGTNMKETYLYLDGIRIYQPSDNKDDDVTNDDLTYGNEIDTNFVEIRDLILAGKMLACDVPNNGAFSAGFGTTMWTERRNNTHLAGTDYEYVGNVVGSVNDYLMEGPNNEVYLVGGKDTNTGKSHNGALAFYVNEASARSGGMLHLGVRAIDMGLFYGSQKTGLYAKLQMGVGTGSSASWHDLAVVTSGTEQYIDVPYELCPVVTLGGSKYYQVVVKVAAGENGSAMASFSGLKLTNGLMLSGVEFTPADMTLISGETDAGNAVAFTMFRCLSVQMASNTVATVQEIESGSDYIMNTVDAESDKIDAIEPECMISGANTVLGSLLDMNFFIDPEKLNGTDYHAEIKLYTENGTQTTTVPYADWEVRTNYLVVTQKGLAARQMADKIEVVIYNGDGTQVSNVWTDSIRDYAMRILEDQNDECKTLIVDMLNYGAAAQTEFGYNTDDLANNLLSENQQGYATETVSCTDQLVQGKGYYGSTLTLKDRIILNVYFSDITPDMYAVVTFTDHKGNAHETRVEGSTFSQYNSNVYGVAVNELVVADGDQLVTVTVYDANGNEVASASDTINSYVARQMDGDSIYEMITKFTTSAYAFFH